MDKLSRLEHIIKRLASENTDDADAANAGQPQDADPAQRSAKSEGDDKQVLFTASGESSEVQVPNSSSLDVQFGRLVVSDSMSYYVGNVLWANLANEVRPTTLLPLIVD
jgi:hypothetical protein